MVRRKIYLSKSYAKFELPLVSIILASTQYVDSKHYWYNTPIQQNLSILYLC